MMARTWQRALVVGLGKSGLAAARLLAALGVAVRGYDRRLEVPDGPAERFSGDEPPAAAFAGIDLLVLSPGVPPERALALRAEHAPHAEVHGEMGLALAIVHERMPPTRTVLVTGTNGKSTVTAMTGALLAAGARRVFVGGNLGDPLCDRVADALADPTTWPQDLVLECSSFQLETMHPLPTDVAMLLNVTPDHLDRYATMDAYAQTKAKVFAGLPATGLALLDAEDAWTERLAPAGPIVARIGDHDGARLLGDRLVPRDGESLPRSVLRLPGRHNARNALFALAATRHLGVSLDACAAGLAGFEGLPHRMALVRDLDGVVYYDDSKATNVASALASLGGLERPFVLIAGGLAKGDDLAPLRDVLAARGRGLVAIGDSADRFIAMAHGTVPTQRAASLDEAVGIARTMASPGEAVVLAPACASFDMFKNYAHRGDVFAAAVRALT